MAIACRRSLQDFIRLEPSAAVHSGGAHAVNAALDAAAATNLARLDTILARGYEGGTNLSGGQWQRITLGSRTLRREWASASWCSTNRAAQLEHARRGRGLRAPARVNAALTAF